MNIATNSPEFIAYVESLLAGLSYLVIIVAGARLFPGTNMISVTKAHWLRLKEEMDALLENINNPELSTSKRELQILKEKASEIFQSLSSASNAFLWRGWKENELWRLMHAIEIKIKTLRIKMKNEDFTYITELIRDALVGIQDLITNPDFKQYEEELNEWKKNLEEHIKALHARSYIAKLKKLLDDKDIIQKIDKIDLCPSDKELDELKELITNKDIKNKEEALSLIECIKQECKYCHINKDPAEALSLFYRDYYTIIDNHYLSLTKDYNRSLFLNILGVFLATALMLCFALFLPESKNLSAIFIWFLGLAGGLLSRYNLILEAKKLPNDYGLSWSLIFLAPTAGGISALLGVLLVYALGSLNILDQGFIKSLKEPELTYGLAVLLGYSGKFFAKAVEKAENKLEGKK
jgi:hypothetical protein